MPMITMPSLEAQNNFGRLLDTAIREPVEITRRGRHVVYVISREAIRDMVDGILAQQAEQEGFASDDEVSDFLASLKNA
jgi:prevent-host-death family protein